MGVQGAGELKGHLPPTCHPVTAGGDLGPGSVPICGPATTWLPLVMGNSPRGPVAFYVLNSANFWTNLPHKEAETTARLY